MSALPSAYASARNPVSAVNLLSAQPEPANPAARNARTEAQASFRTDTRANSFSQTLQSRMPEPPRNEAPRPQDRQGAERSTAAEGRNSPSPERASSPDGARAAEADQPADAPPSTQAQEGNSGSGQNPSDAQGQAQTAAQPQQPATAGSPEASAAASVAGLPAAIAALLSGQQDSAAVEDGTESLLTNPNGGKKSIHNSALLTSLGQEIADGNANPGLQAKAIAVAANAVSAGIAAGRGAEAATGLVKEGAEGGASLQGTGLHLHGSPQLLRQAQGAQPTPQLPVQTPAGQQAWAEDVSNQVRWMLGRAESKAELVLTPPSLGKLEVSISLNGDHTTAQFIASSQAARDALERAMPHLREILQQAGIMLGDANVSTSGQQGRDGGTSRQDGGNGQGDEALNGAGTQSGSGGGWVKQQQGMVDTFA
ncbi:flagellar hook-length control protein FliK [Thauera sp. ZXT1-4]|uniref:flagellar hook-length control protein FliK n=1 Tax=Thauera sp. ZXT1-4 TaxID=3460294 RepID=UPI004040CA1E